MRSDWKEYIFDDLVIRNQGVNTTTEKVSYSDSGYPVVRANNISQYNIDEKNIVYIDSETFERIKDTCKPNKNDILYTNIGSQLGNATKVKMTYDFIIAWNVLRLQTNTFIDADFMVYTLNSPYYKKHISSLNSSSTMPFVSGKVLGKIKFKLPPLPTQKKIAHILSTLDDKIELNRKMNETLEAMAQTLFKSWFVDFDPVHAKVDAKSDAELEKAATKLGISKEILDLFPSEFQESEMGMIPLGWEVKLFGDVVIPKKGKSITKKTIVEGNIPVVAGGLSPAYYHNQYNVTAPIITVSASGANAGYVNLYNKNIWASDCSYVNKTNSNYVFSHYVFLKAKQYEITRMQQGAAQPHIYPSHLMRLNIVDCGDYLWNFFENIINPIFEKIAGNELEIQTLKKTRDTLLPKLLSGELDVSKLHIGLDDAVQV